MVYHTIDLLLPVYCILVVCNMRQYDNINKKFICIFIVQLFLNQDFIFFHRIKACSTKKLL